MIFRTTIFGVVSLAFVLTESRSETCYVDGTAGCEELAQTSGYSCTATDCEPMYGPILGLHLGDFCPQGEQNVNLHNDPVNVAIHEPDGLDSTSTGATVYCVSIQDCKRTCGFPPIGATEQCKGDGAWTHSAPFTHTYAAGNSCDMYGGGYGP